MNAGPPSFGNSQCIEGNRHVNRQLQYYGKEMTKICMGVIGKVPLIIHVEKQGCLKKLDSETSGEEPVSFVLNDSYGPLKCW